MLKTFKQFVSNWTGSKKSKPTSNDIHNIPKRNSPEHIRDNTFGNHDEAARQLDNFHRETFKWRDHEGNVNDHPWSETDSRWNADGTNEPPQDTKMRDHYYQKFGLRKPRYNDPEKDPHYTARYLDHMHHHFPGLAHHLNMAPIDHDGEEEFTSTMTTAEKLNHHYGDTFHKIVGSIIPGHHERLEKKRQADFRSLISGFKSSGLGTEIQKMEHDKVKEFHTNNSDMHHLSGHQAYGPYTASHEGILIRPVGKKEFIHHWDKLNGRR